MNMKTQVIKVSLILCMTFVVFGFVGCDKKMKDLIGSKWTLEKITTSHGQELIPSDFYTMQITEDMVHVKLDINACKLNYTMKEGNVVEFDKNGMCTRACCDSELAKTFMENLSGSMKISLEDDRLTLTGENIVTFTRWKETDVRRDKTENYLKIKRTGCFGTCPIYEMTLFEDGSASYIGKRFVEVTGKANHKFDPKLVAGLMNRAKRLDFGSLQPVYDNPSISDMEAVFIEYNGVPIKVRYEEDVPKELLKLIGDVHQCAIDALWVKKNN